MKRTRFFRWLGEGLKARSRVHFWFALTLIIVLTYSLLGLQEAFAGNNIVQDDARQHVFWMRRFLDPNLFPDDLIADYFQAVAPWGYQFVYWLPAQFGIDPLLWNKLLPVILNLITAGFCFGMILEFISIPFAAFSGSILLAQSLGFTAAVVSGTQKAFIYPLFLAFIYFLLKKRFIAILIVIALQGVFYPQILLISAVTLFIRLFHLKQGRIQLHQQNFRLSISGLIVAMIVMLPFALKTNQFGPVITPEQAKQLPEFLPGGRASFFYPDDPSKFWLKGRSGLRFASALTPVTNAFGILLPILMRFPRWFPLTKKVSHKISLLAQIWLASGIMFAAAHLFLFQLHLPSRYTEHSLRILFSITTGIVIVILIDATIQLAETSWAHRAIKLFLPLATIVFFGTPLLFYPLLLNGFPSTAYKQGTAPDLYTVLQQQPKDTLVASMAAEVNNIPTFAQRSILVGSEYAIPYHWGYYQPFRQRTLDLITAQYSPNPQIVSEFIENYQINFWLLNKAAFQVAYLANNDWLQQYQPATNQAEKQLQREQTPVLETVIENCSSFENEQLVLLSSDCVVSEIQ